MNLFNIINTIKSTCISYKGVQEFNYGDIYEFENNKMRKYVNMNFTLQNLSNDADSDGMVVNGVLFCVDRMTDNGDNKLMVQSNCTDILKKVLVRLTENNLSWTLSGETYEVFSEKFADLCAGAWVTFSIEVGEDIICSDDEFVVKTLDVTRNGLYEVVGYDRILVNVHPTPVQSKTVAITKNKTEVITPDSGYNLDKVTVDVKVPPTPVQSKTVTITKNKTEVITPDSGYNLDKVTVDVKVHPTPVQSKTVTITKNKTEVITPDSGYNLDKVTVDVKVPLKLVNGTKLAYSSWTNVPVYDFSDITDWSHMFDNCAEVTNIDFSDKNIIGHCSYLLNYTGNYRSPSLVISNLNTSKVVNAYALFSVSYVSEFRNCTFDFSSCTSLSYAFSSLKAYRGGITLFNTSKVTSINYLFSSSNFISSISAFECDSVKSQDGFFSYVNSVKDIGGFINLGKGFISSQVVDLSLTHDQNHITQQSIQNIIDTIYDLNLNPKAAGSTLKFREKMMKDVTDDMKQQIASKGWTLSY